MARPLPPIALLLFNRPEPLRQVFAQIAAAKPSKLFLIADGPRPSRPADATGCELARKVVEEIDWDCEVLRNYSKVNLGCGQRVSSGLNWVFSQCKEAIILEDDCLPHADFFGFCAELLERYRNDARIMHISGDSFHGDAIQFPSSYYFSRFSHIWGWATWASAWQRYDFAMKSWPQWKSRVGELFADPFEQRFWTNTIENVYSGKVDTWDIQWAYALLTHAALAINPASNLISNIGFGAEATHTHKDSWVSRMPTRSIGEIIHPVDVIEHRSADSRTFEKVFGGDWMRRAPRTNVGRATNWVKRQFKQRTAR